MKNNWKDMSAINKVVLSVRIILSIVIIVLAFLQIHGVLETAVNYNVPLLGIYFLLLSFQEWKSQRYAAIFSICVALFILIVTYIVWFGN